MTLRPQKYRLRLIDSVIEKHLRAFGAIEVFGCKWCGKTWSSLAHGNSVIVVDEKKTKPLLEADPSLVLEGPFPKIIDEWQEVPSIWDTVRHGVDNAAGKRGLYILTGSSTPAKDQVSHSGAGRISRLRMRPMSLFESGDSDGHVSLNGLFDNHFTPKKVSTDLRFIANLISRGGWPESLELAADLVELVATQYLDVFLSSAPKNSGLSEQLMRRLLVSLARNIGSAVTYKTLEADIIQLSKKDPASEKTLERYLEFLIEHFFIENLSGWDAPVKARSRVRTKPKRTFADPSLPTALLGLNSQRLLGEMQVFGQLFEEMCIRDLRVYTSALSYASPDALKYYRDSDGLEVDAIIELRDGRWAAIEIKLSENKVQDGVDNLIRLKNKVLANPLAKNSEPSFMAVIVGKTEFCRQTPEGVYVIPITSLTA